MGEKKPSIGTWELEEEAREKGESSEKLTKIKKKKEEIYRGYATYNGLSREFQDTSPAYHQEEKEK